MAETSEPQVRLVGPGGHTWWTTPQSQWYQMPGVYGGVASLANPKRTKKTDRIAELEKQIAEKDRLLQNQDAKLSQQSAEIDDLKDRLDGYHRLTVITDARVTDYRALILEAMKGAPFDY